MKKIAFFSSLFLTFFACSISAQELPQVTGLTISVKSAHKIVVKWSAVENAEQYQVRVTKSENNKLVTKKHTNKTKVKINHLKNDIAYDIKVKALCDDGQGDYSEPEEIVTTEVESITLSACSTATCDNGQEPEKSTADVCWETVGYSDLGYKLVWSKTTNPEYPSRSTDTYQYYSDPDTSSGEIYDFDGSGTYYVRVCEYLGGKCGIYSNEISVNL